MSWLKMGAIPGGGVVGAAASAALPNDGLDIPGCELTKKQRIVGFGVTFGAGFFLSFMS